jgi:hypothetical protein
MINVKDLFQPKAQRGAAVKQERALSTLRNQNSNRTSPANYQLDLNLEARKAHRRQ